MKKKYSILLAALVAFVLVLSGCAGGGSSSTASDSAESDANTTTESTEESTEESSESSADLAESESQEEEKAEEESEASGEEATAEAVPTSTDTEINDVQPEKQVYVTPDYVKDVIDGNEDVGNYVLAEVTWGEASDSPDYLEKHIPGATHFNTDAIEEGPIWNVKSPEELEKAFLDYGVTSDTTLILYGPDTGVDRFAFTALYLGVDNVKVLDGGLQAWEDAGYETESEEVKPTPAEADFGVAVPAHPEYIISLEDTADRLENDEDFQLVSIRSENEWRGIESGYSYIPKAGEPEGAYWGRPLLRGSNGSDANSMDDYKNEDGTNKDFEEILAMWEYEGISIDKPIALYCGTAWRSSLPWLMMYERGYEPLHFDSSWNDWQMHDELPVQVGDPKQDDVVHTTVGELDDDRASE